MIRISPDFYMEFWNFWIFYGFCHFKIFFKHFLPIIGNYQSCGLLAQRYGCVLVVVWCIILCLWIWILRYECQKHMIHIFSEKLVKKFFARENFLLYFNTHIICLRIFWASKDCFSDVYADFSHYHLATLLQFHDPVCRQCTVG